VWSAENAVKVADVTWQFDKNADLLAPTIWDRGMPEGEENERHGFGKIVKSDVVLRELSGSLRQIENGKGIYPDSGGAGRRAAARFSKAHLQDKISASEEEVQVAL
jgi:hypothetical protein